MVRGCPWPLVFPTVKSDFGWARTPTVTSGKQETALDRISVLCHGASGWLLRGGRFGAHLKKPLFLMKWEIWKCEGLMMAPTAGITCMHIHTHMCTVRFFSSALRLHLVSCLQEWRREGAREVVRVSPC